MHTWVRKNIFFELFLDVFSYTEFQSHQLSLKNTIFFSLKIL